MEGLFKYMTRRAVGAGLLSGGVVIFFLELYVIYNPSIFHMLEGPADLK